MMGRLQMMSLVFLLHNALAQQQTAACCFLEDQPSVKGKNIYAPLAPLLPVSVIISSTFFSDCNCLQVNK